MIQDTEQQIKFDTQQNNVVVLGGNDLKFKSWAYSGLWYMAGFGLLWVFWFLFGFLCLFLNSVQDIYFTAYNLYKSTL